MLTNVVVTSILVVVSLFSLSESGVVYKFARIAIKNLIDCVWVSRIPKVWKQSNLDYSSLNYVFSFGKV